MAEKWSNWSESVQFTPGAYIEPKNEEEFKAAIEYALEKGKKVRVAGAGHSSSHLVVTDEILVSMKNFKSVERIDTDKSEAWIGTGLTVKEAGTKLLEHNLSFHNTGDVDIQYVSGAISTGTHGTGYTLKNLSSMLIGCRMMGADGKMHEYDEQTQGKDFFDAMRVSMGTFGIMTSMKLKLLPAFKLERKEWCAHTDHCLDNLDQLISENRNFDFYWYPRSDLVKLRTLNEPGKGTQQIDYATCQESITGWAIDVLPKERDLKFDEVEYALPLEAAPQCFRIVRKMIKENFRKEVAWRLLYRTIDADDYYLSPCFGRKTVTISLHHNAGLPYKEYFESLEPIFRDFDGRPHWGKKHTMTSKDISQLYPKWNDFHSIRNQMDPQGFFLNDYLRKQLFDQ